MRLEQLRQLVALHEHGTISQAARSLYISQPSMSVSLRELEEELGAQLIIRSNKGVLFTPVGTAVLERAKRVLLELEHIRRVCEDAALSGRLRIASTPHYCNSILVEVKLSIESSYPNVHIELSENDSGEIVRQVEKGEVDAGVVQLCDLDIAAMEQKAAHGDIIYCPLFTEEMCIAVNDRHPLLEQPEVTLEELFAYPYGSYKGAMNTWIQQQLDALPGPHRVFHADEIDLLRTLQFRANAFTVIPVQSIPYGNHLFSGKMVPLEVEGIRLTSEVGMLTRRGQATQLGRHLTQALQEQSRIYHSQGRSEQSDKRSGASSLPT